jgi:hypothetical protein
MELVFLSQIFVVIEHISVMDSACLLVLFVILMIQQQVIALLVEIIRSLLTKEHVSLIRFVEIDSITYQMGAVKILV